jgi:hypothetical protein
MTPPIWLDETGQPLPTKPCPRCAAEVPIIRRLSSRAVDWMPCATVWVVNWCGHEEWLPSPWGLLPVLEGRPPRSLVQ